jgi:hypothetical protein
LPSQTFGIASVCPGLKAARLLAWLATVSCSIGIAGAGETPETAAQFDPTPMTVRVAPGGEFSLVRRDARDAGPSIAHTIRQGDVAPTGPGSPRYQRYRARARNRDATVRPRRIQSGGSFIVLNPASTREVVITDSPPAKLMQCVLNSLPRGPP